MTLVPASSRPLAQWKGEEVVQHLPVLIGANVEVTVDISAEAPDAFPDKNCRTSRFRTQGFAGSEG